MILSELIEQLMLFNDGSCEDDSEVCVIQKSVINPNIYIKTKIIEVGFINVIGKGQLILIETE